MALTIQVYFKTNEAHKRLGQAFISCLTGDTNKNSKDVNVSEEGHHQTEITTVKTFGMMKQTVWYIKKKEKEKKRNEKLVISTTSKGLEDHRNKPPHNINRTQQNTLESSSISVKT